MLLNYGMNIERTKYLLGVVCILVSLFLTR